ncbi:SDR family NAD(P)-dependent oxidoreductase [Streptomyces sp. NBC_01237]|uniref:SDR family NAD(P)-dependent oxidoreductase n=1 Tax=Streptomyces sp. NBC_01237 TaxID=2903790 RepID=UPI002DD88744|nr:SDR family NAD(P)-dependent oxidoreductase [Streptomyces sp. NBC_01237]WRZ76543.1 SDR family oxidoreductase [Streptomyces sp. NBC_01237]
MADLKGKSCVVTGAAKGLGRATAIFFAQSGALVTATDIDEAGLRDLREMLTAGGHQIETVAGDIAEVADVRRMIGAAVERFGCIDVLVANAGVIPMMNAIEATAEDWDHVMRIDGRGTFLTCKYAIAEMLKTGGGSIVCVSSISGIAGQAGQATYGPAKFVSSGLTKHLAIEWAAQGIRVNAVAPSTTRTEWVRQMEEDSSGAELLADVKRIHPMRRLGEPQEVAEAIAFLASDAASFITGVVLPVDGGYLAQ